MDRNELVTLIRSHPFEPFTVRMSNGDSYEVQHPELAMLTPTTLYVFDPQSKRVVRCALGQIASVEQAEVSDAGSSP